MYLDVHTLHSLPAPLLLIPLVMHLSELLLPVRSSSVIAAAGLLEVEVQHFPDLLGLVPADADCRPLV